MEVRFLLRDIKDISKIYSSTKEESDKFGEITKTEYVAIDYYMAVLNQLKESCCEIGTYHHQGCLERIANEVFTINTENFEYHISFTFDTYENHNQLSIKITLDESEFSKTEDINSNLINLNYDLTLEKIKIQLKEILIKDWSSCIWVVDEQSADLAVKLYGLLYNTENHIRAFVNRVMTAKFGVKWFELLEFKKAHADYEKTKVDFKRTVPCFINIDDKLLSLTIDTLLQIINGIKIYERSLEIVPDIQQKLIEKLIQLDNNSLYEQLRGLLISKYDLWNDVFSPLFSNCPNIEQEMKNIIKNRNHIAHNKLIDRSAYIKMKENINTVKGFITKAEMKFDEIAVSDEMYETWEAIDENERENKEYINQRIEDETGIIIRDEKSIFEYYSDYSYDLYMTISDGEYFNNSVIISDYTKPKIVQTEQKIFSVKSNVKDEYGFDTFVQFDITEGQGEESNMLIVAKNENKIILETTIQYRNGEAHEDYMECTYIPDGDSFIDEDAVKTFTNELIEYIQDEMNEIKNEIDAMKYSVVKDGGELPVADIPCWSCCQEYISVNDDIYPFGKCINCGEYNELKKCGRCESLYDPDEGNDFLCGYCKSKFESE